MFEKSVNETILEASLQLMVDIFEEVVDNLNVRQRFFNRDNFIKNQRPQDQQVQGPGGEAGRGRFNWDNFIKNQRLQDQQVQWEQGEAALW